MNYSDIIVIAVIAICITGVLVYMRKQKKSGGSGCHSGCSGCSKSDDCCSGK